jgi:hypothetical protein
MVMPAALMLSHQICWRASIWPTYWVWPLPYSGQRSCVFKPSDITINCRTSGESGEKPGVTSTAVKRTLHLFVKSSGID